MNAFSLSIIIVHYKVKYFLEHCLLSLEAALQNINAEIIVIDNASQDDSLPYLQPKFPHVTFIEEPVNSGFAKANNKAIVLAKGEYILLLNPDTLVSETALHSCMQFLQTHSQSGAAGVKMLNGNGNFLPESKRSYPHPFTALLKLTGLASLFPDSTIINRYALSALPSNAVQPVPILSGAFIMVKRHVLQQVGGFDEQFFMYAEDIDLSYRIEQAGYKNYYIGTASIIHFKGKSTHQYSWKRLSYFYGTMHLFVKKYYAKQILLQAILHAGIIFKTLSNILVLPFLKFKERILTEKKQFIQQTILIGSSTDVAEAIHRFEAYFHNKNLRFWYASPEQLPIHSTSYKHTEIIFCIGQFTYSNAIPLLPYFQKAVSVKWFHIKANSLIANNANAILSF